MTAEVVTYNPPDGSAPITIAAGLSDAEWAAAVRNMPDPDMNLKLPARRHPTAPVQPAGPRPAVGMGKPGGIYQQPGPPTWGPEE